MKLSEIESYKMKSDRQVKELIATRKTESCVRYYDRVVSKEWCNKVIDLFEQSKTDTFDSDRKSFTELDIEGIRTEVIEAMKDPSGEALAALRVKYPFLGRRDTKDIANMAMGGRIGFNQGLLAGPTPQQRQAQQSISTIEAPCSVKLFTAASRLLIMVSSAPSSK